MLLAEDTYAGCKIIITRCEIREGWGRLPWYGDRLLASSQCNSDCEAEVTNIISPTITASDGDIVGYE